MPKVEYTAAKGLFQSSGSGVEFGGNTVQGHNKKIITHSASSGDLALTIAESGALISITGNASSQKITLPAAASSAGCHYDFVVHTAHANNLEIETNASEVIVTMTASANNAVTRTQNTGGCQLTASGIAIGDRVSIMCDGEKWYATAFSNAANKIASVA